MQLSENNTHPQIAVEDDKSSAYIHSFMLWQVKSLNKCQSHPSSDITAQAPGLQANQIWAWAYQFH